MPWRTNCASGRANGFRRRAVTRRIARAAAGGEREGAGRVMLLQPRRAATTTPVELTSPACAAGRPIPERHACDGADLSPPLEWTSPPEGTVALALCVDDPEAGRYPFTHWLAWALPAGAGGLGEGEAAPAEGRNDF